MFQYHRHIEFRLQKGFLNKCLSTFFSLSNIEFHPLDFIPLKVEISLRRLNMTPEKGELSHCAFKYTFKCRYAMRDSSSIYKYEKSSFQHHSFRSKCCPIPHCKIVSNFSPIRLIEILKKMVRSKSCILVTTAFQCFLGIFERTLIREKLQFFEQCAC